MFRFGAAYPGEVCPASAARRSRETIAFLPSVMANPRETSTVIYLGECKRLAVTYGYLGVTRLLRLQTRAGA